MTTRHMIQASRMIDWRRHGITIRHVNRICILHFELKFLLSMDILACV